jgi:hypothetical protein
MKSKTNQREGNGFRENDEGNLGPLEDFLLDYVKIEL